VCGSDVEMAGRRIFDNVKRFVCRGFAFDGGPEIHGPFGNAQCVPGFRQSYISAAVVCLPECDGTGWFLRGPFDKAIDGRVDTLITDEEHACGWEVVGLQRLS